MFEVLVYVYENYWRGDACPEPEQLGRKLSAQGFDADEIREALHWLDGLSLATRGVQLQRHADGTSATVLPGTAADRKSTRLNSSHSRASRMPSSA